MNNLLVYFLNVFELRVSPKSNYEMHCAGESYRNKTSVRLCRGARGAGRGEKGLSNLLHHRRQKLLKNNKTIQKQNCTNARRLPCLWHESRRRPTTRGGHVACRAELRAISVFEACRVGNSNVCGSSVIFAIHERAGGGGGGGERAARGRRVAS